MANASDGLTALAQQDTNLYRLQSHGLAPHSLSKRVQRPSISGPVSEIRLRLGGFGAQSGRGAEPSPQKAKLGPMSHSLQRRRKRFHFAKDSKKDSKKDSENRLCPRSSHLLFRGFMSVFRRRGKASLTCKHGQNTS